jgi:metal-dependent amidase/aminoacylase/carboxypeptidase family protein
MDAVPMEETPNREYASRIEGRNHCCGHDTHSAIVAAIAEVLVGLPGTVTVG